MSTSIYGFAIFDKTTDRFLMDFSPKKPTSCRWRPSLCEHNTPVCVFATLDEAKEVVKELNAHRGIGANYKVCHITQHATTTYRISFHRFE